MAPVNASWHRWIYASVADHLTVGAALIPVELRIEFTSKRSAAWKAAATKAEATLTGPMTKETNPGLFNVWFDVFIVLSSKADSNNYGHVDAAGGLANLLDQCILIKDYGDTGLLTVGSIRPRSDANENVEVKHLKPKEGDDLIHSTISARYFGLFTE